jgi:Cft2 family RNA processing exonuclease
VLACPRASKDNKNQLKKEEQRKNITKVTQSKSSIKEQATYKKKPLLSVPNKCASNRSFGYEKYLEWDRVNS